MNKRHFTEFRPSRLDRRLGGVLVAAMVAVLVGLTVDATTGPAMAGVAPAAPVAGATMLAAAPTPAAVR
jgi:negative regulator of sigma E activity